MAGSNDTLQQQLQMGGVILDNDMDPGALSQAAEALGLTVFNVDCDRAKSKSAVLRAIAGAVDFPEYFGGNLDALLDCLTTTVLDQQAGALVMLCNLHENEPALAEHVDDIMDTFADAAEYARDNAKVLAVARLVCEAP